jgi:hypothetical protein
LFLLEVIQHLNINHINEKKKKKKKKKKKNPSLNEKGHSPQGSDLLLEMLGSQEIKVSGEIA